MAMAATVGQPSNMPVDNPVRRVDFADVAELSKRFAENGEVKFCRCMASKQFPYCDGSHVELNKQGVTNVGPLVVKAAPLPKGKVVEGSASNMPADNPMRRVDFIDIEDVQQCCANDGEQKFCRCLASKKFPLCDGSHVELNKQGVTNTGPIVFKKMKPALQPQASTPWGSPMPQFCEEAVSGDGTLEKVGIKMKGKVQCSSCAQRFESQKFLELHVKYMHHLESPVAEGVPSSKQQVSAEEMLMKVKSADMENDWERQYSDQSIGA